MRTLVFPDRLNAVFVKELRQSIHDKSLPYMGIAVVAAQLLAGYVVWAGGIRPERDLFELSLFPLFGAMLLLRMMWAQRAGKERSQEGFDPLTGTGYPAWRAVGGRAAAEACMLAAVALLALPWFGWGAAAGVLTMDLAKSVLVCMFWLFAAGESFHYVSSFANGRKYSAFILLFAFLWIAFALGGGVSLFGSTRISGIRPKICGFLLLAGLSMICGQIQNRMPVRAERSVSFKIMLLATALYLAWQYQPIPELPLYGMGWFFMFGSLYERREPSRRQTASAARFVSLFLGSGVLPGFLLAMALFAAAAILGGKPNLAPILLSVFYLQTALFASCKWRVPPFAAWLLLSTVFNLPFISGDLFPWATVLSFEASRFVGENAAIGFAAAACILSVALNAKLYWNFACRYFERKEK